MLATVSSFLRNTLPPRCKTAFLLPNLPHLRYVTNASYGQLPHTPQAVESPQGDAKITTWDISIPAVKGTNQAVNLAYGIQNSDASLKPSDKWAAHSDTAKLQLKDSPPAHTYAGRSVKVKAGNFADAYARLQGILQRNRVQAELRRTERHEKKGVKRRRLSSERWRKQFAHEVPLTLDLIMHI
ncbi:hypothetical protein H0H92_002664 [Tricholoma furcatifolium]|nr:hypothetical protein H0H92_002664 [Tricholoma furcatifolium]